MGLRDDKLIKEFFTETHEAFDYLARAKIDAIKEGVGLLKLLTPAEYKALQKLIETKTGQTALKKLLVECGESNLFSILAYIDGCTGIKPLEIVNAHTRLPIAEETLHEHLSTFRHIKKS